MDFCIGLPAGLPGTSAADFLEWARQAERRGFTTAAVPDRLVYPGFDTLTAIAAAAAVTSRIKLMSAVVVAPLHTNVALFAKQVTTVDNLSGGRLLLGLGVGSRPDDFSTSGVDLHARGRILDAMLPTLVEIFDAKTGIGPAPITPGGPPILFGGRAPAVFARLGAYGSGWICATSGGPEGLRSGAELARAAFSEAGRNDTPRLYALAPRFVLDPAARARAAERLATYEAHRGAEAAQRVGAMLTEPAAVAEACAAFEAAGCDELVFHPATADPAEVNRLADALGL